MVLLLSASSVASLPNPVPADESDESGQKPRFPPATKESTVSGLTTAEAEGSSAVESHGPPSLAPGDPTTSPSSRDESLGAQRHFATRRLALDTLSAWKSWLEESTLTDVADGNQAIPLPVTKSEAEIPSTPRDLEHASEDSATLHSERTEELRSAREIASGEGDDIGHEMAVEGFPVPDRSTASDDSRESERKPHVNTKAPSASSSASQGANPKTAGVQSEARLLGDAMPPYPTEARRRGIEGSVLLRIRVDAKGKVEVAVVEKSSGSELLDGAALEFAEAADFSPAVRDGKSVPTTIRLPVRFRLVPR